MAAKTRSLFTIDLPIASPGTARSLSVVRYGQKDARPKAYFQAGVHADEVPGMLVLNHLMRMLNDADDRNEILGEVLILPVANPIGSGQTIMDRLHGRYELATGVNFNRQFPDLTNAVADRIRPHLRDDSTFNGRIIQGAIRAILSEWQPVDDADFWRITLLRLCGDADIILDLHCDSEAVLHMYMGTPIWPLAKDLAQQLGSCATLLAGQSGGNPFDEAIASIWWNLAEQFSDYPIFPSCIAATVELRGASDVSDTVAAQDAENLYLYLQRRGVVAGDPGDLPAPISSATPLDGVDIIRSPAAGVVNYLREPGEHVRENEPVATIIDPLSTHGPTARIDVVAGTSGILFARRAERITRPGQLLCKIAGKTALPWRNPDSLLAD